MFCQKRQRSIEISSLLECSAKCAQEKLISYSSGFTKDMLRRLMDKLFLWKFKEYDMICSVSKEYSFNRIYTYRW